MLTHPERKSRPWLLFFLLILFIVVTAILLTQENSPSSWYALFSSRSLV